MGNKEQESIIDMFDDISEKYDKINSYISFGLERYWRKESTSISIEYLLDSKIDMLVDVACGTGKMIKSWTKQFYKNGISCKKIVGIDPSKGMLDIAKTNISNATFFDNLADNMPLEDNSADVISISYGLRNIVDKQSAFLEFNRVLKDGGLVVVLEFIKDESGSILSKIKEGYIKNIIPLYGKLFADNKDAFVYLGASIENMKEKELRDLFSENGFDLVHLKSFNFGASHTFIAKKVKTISKAKTIAKKSDDITKEKAMTKKEDSDTKIKSEKKVSEKIDSDIDISFTIRKVGISLFIEFFEEFNNLDINNANVADLIVKKKKISISSAKTKTSNARKIIKNNLSKEAIEEVLKSAKLNEAIKKKAKKYLKNIS